MVSVHPLLPAAKRLYYACHLEVAEDELRVNYGRRRLPQSATDLSAPVRIECDHCR
jgi:hypothetical protein